MTKIEYIANLKKGIKKLNLILDDMVTYYGKLDNLDLSLYINKVVSYREYCTEKIKEINKLDEVSVSRINFDKLDKELNLRLKSITLASEALKENSKPYKSYEPSNPFM